MTSREDLPARAVKAIAAARVDGWRPLRWLLSDARRLDLEELYAPLIATGVTAPHDSWLDLPIEWFPSGEDALLIEDPVGRREFRAI